MTAAGADVLYTVALVAGYAVLFWALAALTQLLIRRVQADHHATTFGEAYLLDRDPHHTDIRQAMKDARS